MMHNPFNADATGCLSILRHRGTWPSAQPQGMAQLGGGLEVPIVGTAGTSDPGEFFHLLWFNGCIFAAVLKSDVRDHRPGYDELVSHFWNQPDMWSPVAAASAKAWPTS